MRLTLALLAFVMPNIVLAAPHNSQLDEFSSYQEVKLKMNDEVKNGCWTNLKEVREYAEEKIKMSGMTLNVDETQDYNFAISANGGRGVTPACHGTLIVGLYTRTLLPNGVVALVTIKETVHSLANTSFNNNVLDAVGKFFRKAE